MGEAKHRLEEQEWKAQMALGLALEAGVLVVCPVHGHITFAGSRDITEAYKLGNAKFTKGELKEFKDRREMTDIIKGVVEENSRLYKCSVCLDRIDE